MQVLIDIPEAKRPGITAARQARNASLPAQIQDGETVVGQDGEGNPILGPNMVPNPALIATDEGYITWVLGQAVDSYNQALPAAPPPLPPPGVVGGQAMSCTRKQGIKALARADQAPISFTAPVYEQDIRNMIAAMPETTAAEKLFKVDMAAEFEGAATWQYGNQFFMAMAQALGFTDAQVKALLNLAVTFTN
jgi:hypothetical protein